MNNVQTTHHALQAKREGSSRFQTLDLEEGDQLHEDDKSNSGILAWTASWMTCVGTVPGNNCSGNGKCVNAGSWYAK